MAGSGKVVPSIDFVDLKENMPNFDAMVNSTDPTFTNRESPNGNVTTRTLSGFNAEGDAAILDIETRGDSVILGIETSGNAALGALGGVDSGFYIDSPLMTEYNQYVKYDRAGTIETYKVKTTIPLPYKINFGATPDPLNDVNLQMFNAVTREYVNSNADLHDTLTGAKSRTDLEPGMVVIIEPERASGRFKAVTGETPDEFGILSTSVTGVQLKVITNGTANVMHFGALGNGSTGDSDAIQAAMNAEKIVDFPLPDVFYRIDKTLYPRNNQLLNGEYKWADWYLSADQAKCLKGDVGVDVISTIKSPFSYPALPPTALEFRRGITLKGLHIQSFDALCLKWHYGSQFVWDDCVLRADNSPAFSMRQSVRGRISNSFWGCSNFAGYAGTMYDNCNGITVSGPAQVTSGSIGGTTDISKSSSIKITGIIAEVNGLAAIRVGGLTLAEAGFAEERGNCHDIEVGGYFEECNSACEVGTDAVVFGFKFKGFVSNVGNIITNPESCLTLGAVAGWEVSSSSFIKTGTQPTYKFAQLVGSPFRVATKGRIQNNHVQLHSNPQDVGVPFVLDASYPIGLSGYTFGSSYFDFTGNADIALGTPIDFNVFGERAIFEQECVSNESFTYTYDTTTMGGLIEKIEITSATGVLDSTIRIGSSSVANTNLDQDTSLLVLSAGYVNITPANQLLQPNERLRLQNVAGAGTGKFKVRITYRK